MRFPIRLLIGFIFILALSPTIFAADVYILRAIDVPQQYAGTPTTINFVIENVLFTDPNYVGSHTQDMYVTIRNNQGAIVSGYDNAVVPLVFGSSTLNEQLVIPANILQTGVVYTIDASIDPYGPGGTPFDETTKGNNSARKTFTVLKPVQTFQVPDMPIEIHLLSVLVVFSGLFFFGRSKNETN
jgi:hypothetical protein